MLLWKSSKKQRYSWLFNYPQFQNSPSLREVIVFYFSICFYFQCPPHPCKVTFTAPWGGIRKYPRGGNQFIEACALHCSDTGARSISLRWPDLVRECVDSVLDKPVCIPTRVPPAPAARSSQGLLSLAWWSPMWSHTRCPPAAGLWELFGINATGTWL